MNDPEPRGCSTFCLDLRMSKEEVQLADELALEDQPQHSPGSPAFWMRWLCVPFVSVGVAAVLIWIAPLNHRLFLLVADLVWYGCLVLLCWAPLQAFSAQVLSTPTQAALNNLVATLPVLGALVDQLHGTPHWSSSLWVELLTFICLPAILHGLRIARPPKSQPGAALDRPPKHSPAGTSHARVPELTYTRSGSEQFSAACEIQARWRAKRDRLKASAELEARRKARMRLEPRVLRLIACNLLLAGLMHLCAGWLPPIVAHAWPLMLLGPTYYILRLDRAERVHASLAHGVFLVACLTPSISFISGILVHISDLAGGVEIHNRLADYDIHVRLGDISRTGSPRDRTQMSSTPPANGRCGSARSPRWAI